MADPLEPAFHHYDMPSELAKDRLAFRNGRALADVPSQSFLSMQTTMSSVSGTGSALSKTYDTAPELGNVSNDMVLYITHIYILMNFHAVI